MSINLTATINTSVINLTATWNGTAVTLQPVLTVSSAAGSGDMQTAVYDPGAVGGDAFAADNHVAARVTGSTFYSVQHIQDLFHSAGWTSGGVITSNGDGTCAVTAGTGLIRATDSDTATIYFTDFEAVAALTLTDNSTNYVYIEYNAGSPQVIATTVKRTDYNTNFLLAEIYRNGTTVHINPYVKIAVSDHAGKMIRFNQEVMPYAHVSGGVISETGTRNIAITSGVFWEGLTKFTTGSFDAAGADRFVYYYYNGAAWVEQTGQAQIDNTQYNDTASGLATLTANRYGVHWVYMGAETESDVYVLYGQGDYFLAQAQDSTLPATVPAIISSHCFLVGRIIVQKSAAVFTQIESAFKVGFSPSVVADHNTLSGLQGGAADDYYHLTNAQVSEITANTAKVSFPEAPNDGTQYARKSLGWEAVAGGGGTEYQIYEFSAWIDALSVNQFQGVAAASVFDSEYASNIIANTLSLVNVSGTALSLIKNIGVAQGNQTIESFRLWSEIGASSSITQLSIFKATFSATNTISSITILYEILSPATITWTSDGYFSLAYTDFTSTVINDKDLIYIVYATNSTTDTKQIYFRLKCSID